MPYNMFHLDRYSIPGMYSLAASIPGGASGNLQTIFQANPPNNVHNGINNNGKYTGQRLAVATVVKPQHAEYRLLNNLQLDSNMNDLLVLYCFASSCPTTCTNTNSPYNILHLIKSLIDNGQWTDRAFVFEKIFKPGGQTIIDPNELVSALERLGNAIGSANIFRCYTPQGTTKNNFRCVQCFSGQDVRPECIDYDA